MSYIKFGTKSSFLLAEVAKHNGKLRDQEWLSCVVLQLSQQPEPNVEEAFESASRAYEEDLGTEATIGTRKHVVT